MSILSRNDSPLSSTPESKDISVTINTLYDPNSEGFNPPVGDDVKSLVNFMLAEQVKAFGMTFLDTQDIITYAILMRNFKIMLKTYSPLDVKRGIVLCCRYTDKFPGSTKTIKAAIERWRVRNEIS
jgi:hypothetical protein